MLVSTARQRVGNVLRTVADTTVWDYPHAVDQPQGRTAVLFVESVEPANVACPDQVVTVVAYVFTGRTDGPVTHDVLDTFLDDVLDAFAQQVECRWTAVDSVLYRDTHPAYRITIET